LYAEYGPSTPFGGIDGAQCIVAGERNKFGFGPGVVVQQFADL
jgi:hypothetical protein